MQILEMNVQTGELTVHELPDPVVVVEPEPVVVVEPVVVEPAP